MILALGDSFTYGLELPDCPLFKGQITNPSPSKFSYPAILAQILGKDLLNLSLPGGSNSRIFRLAIDATSKQKFDIVICGWTELSRIDVTLNGCDFPVSVNSAWQESHPWIGSYYKNHYDEDHAMQTWLAQVIALQGYFKSINQRYLFLNMLPAIPSALVPTEIANPKFLHLAKQIDTDYFIGWPNEAMVQWMGDCPKGPNGHPLEVGHERIAEKINEHIRNLGWLS